MVFLETTTEGVPQVTVSRSLDSLKLLIYRT